MKSYKDLDKDIVMNAPEGAMWVVVGDSHQDYYKYNEGEMYVDNTSEDSGLVWILCFDHKLNDWVYSEIKNLIPLPNIEIPWEATENSVCPVEDGTDLEVTLVNGLVRRDTSPEYWYKGGIFATSYKIIDEKYLPLEYDPAIEALVNHLEKDVPQPEKDSKKCITEIKQKQLIRRLEFLQLLTHKFPEIKGEVVKLMSVELDAWWHEEVEREQSGE